MKQQLYDPIRKTFLEATPEEKIRQGCIQKLFNLGFPKYLIAIEMPLSKLVKNEKIPHRRIDILCYAKDGEENLFPLLMIECKAEKISRKSIEQVLGYNYYINAAFVAIINEVHVLLGWFDKEKEAYQFSNGLPSYEYLWNASMKNNFKKI